MFTSFALSSSALIWWMWAQAKRMLSFEQLNGTDKNMSDDVCIRIWSVQARVNKSAESRHNALDRTDTKPRTKVSQSPTQRLHNFKEHFFPPVPNLNTSPFMSSNSEKCANQMNHCNISYCVFWKVVSSGANAIDGRFDLKIVPWNYAQLIAVIVLQSWIH